MAGAAQAALPLRARARRLSRRAIAIALAALVLFALYMLWLRDSSLVAVKTVEIEGAGSDAKLERALTDAARDMTTLHVRNDELARAAEPFPLVDSVSADPRFPSTLAIHVELREPVGLIGEGSSAVAVAADGTILRGLQADGLRLPRLPLGAAPGRERLVGTAREQALVLGAAPAAMRRYAEVSFHDEQGVGVELSGGVDLRFGDAARAADKWRSAAAVLADPDLGALDYVDLRVPDRPAVGGVGHAPPPLAPG